MPYKLTCDRQYHFFNIPNTFYFGPDCKYTQPCRPSQGWIIRWRGGPLLIVYSDSANKEREHSVWIAGKSGCGRSVDYLWYTCQFQLDLCQFFVSPASSPASPCPVYLVREWKVYELLWTTRRTTWRWPIVVRKIQRLLENDCFSFHECCFVWLP